MYVIVMEHAPGIIAQVQLILGKSGGSAYAWAFACAELVNELFKKNTPLTQVINLLSGITTGKSAYVGKGVECRSGPEGLAIALMRYRNSIKEDVNNVRSPKFTNRLLRD
jgi:hypothetical protein